MTYKCAIDSGHSKVTSGKRNFDGTLLEYEFNMDVSKRIQKHLSRHGVESKIFQVENTNQKVELNERIRQINLYNPDIVVSIHANAYGTDWNNANGWEIYYYASSLKGIKLAQFIHSESIPYLGLTDRRIKSTTTLAMVRRPIAPAVLIEHGFMSNKKECELLKSDEFREKCAIADTKGILKYFGIQWKDEDMGENKIKDTTVNVGDIEITGKLINGVTYVPFREFIEAFKRELDVTWDKIKGAGIKL